MDFVWIKMSYKTACYVIHIILLYCVVLILVDMRLLLLLFIKKTQNETSKAKDAFPLSSEMSSKD